MQKGIFAASLLCCSGALHAASIDLTDGVFSSVTYDTYVQGPLGPIVAFSETSHGVTFSFARVSGQFRRIGPWGDGGFATPPFAMDIGGGGGSVASFTLVSSHDVTLDAFSGFAQQYNTAPVFDVTGPDVASSGNAFPVSGFLATVVPGTDGFVGGPLSLSAGAAYLFTVTTAGAATSGAFTAFTFTPTPVPLPAALPAMAAALAGLAGVRRRG